MATLTAAEQILGLFHFYHEDCLKERREATLTCFILWVCDHPSLIYDETIPKERDAKHLYMKAGSQSKYSVVGRRIRDDILRMNRHLVEIKSDRTLHRLGTNEMWASILEKTAKANFRLDPLSYDADRNDEPPASSSPQETTQSPTIRFELPLSSTKKPETQKRDLLLTMEIDELKAENAYLRKKILRLEHSLTSSE